MELRPIINAQPEREIVVDEYGTFLAKVSERLALRRDGKTDREVALYDVEQITIASNGVTLSSDLIHECTERGIRINFVDFRGQPYAMISSPTLTGTVLTRRAQLQAFHDGRGAEWARIVVRAKIQNQVNTLRYFGKYRKGQSPELWQRIMDRVERMRQIASTIDDAPGDDCDEVRPGLMSIEGRAADLYWQAVGELLPAGLFPGREHQGARDPVNMMLNYGYGVLYSKVWGALLLAGLEPFAGFLHVDRPGKPSLVLDAIEEYRQAIVDRPIIGIFGKGTSIGLDEGKLDTQSRRLCARKIQERLDSLEAYEAAKHKLSTIVQRQARHLATCLRGERRYVPFVATW